MIRIAHHGNIGLSSASDGRQGAEELVRRRFQAEDDARRAWLEERCQAGRCHQCGAVRGLGSTPNHCARCSARLARYGSLDPQCEADDG